MQKKVELNDIPKLMQEYTNKYLNHIYYCWVQQLSLLKGSSHFNIAIGQIFFTLPTQHILRFIPNACTSTTNVTLDWKDFVTFF